jgi:hypothetical protein
MSELQSVVDDEVDMSISSSSVRNTAPTVGDLTPPPSLDRGRSQKSAFVRAGEIYESFQIGMETPETPADLPIRPPMTSTDTQIFKRRKTSMSSLRSLGEPPITTSLNLAESDKPTALSIPENEGTDEPESMFELEDDLANTSLIEDTQIDDTMEQDHITVISETSLTTQGAVQGQTVHDNTNVKVDLQTFSQPVTRRDYTRSTARDEPPAVNEMTVVASVVGEVLMETLK